MQQTAFEPASRNNNIEQQNTEETMQQNSENQKEQFHDAYESKVELEGALIAEWQQIDALSYEDRAQKKSDIETKIQEFSETHETDKKDVSDKLLALMNDPKCKEEFRKQLDAHLKSENTSDSKNMMENLSLHALYKLDEIAQEDVAVKKMSLKDRLSHVVDCVWQTILKVFGKDREKSTKDLLAQLTKEPEIITVTEQEEHLKTVKEHLISWTQKVTEQKNAN